MKVRFHPFYFSLKEASRSSNDKLSKLGKGHEHQIKQVLQKSTSKQNFNCLRYVNIGEDHAIVPRGPTT